MPKTEHPVSRSAASPPEPRPPKTAAPETLIAQLKKIRVRIDDLDAHIVRLINERMSCAVEVGSLKHHLGQEVFQPEREKAVMANVYGSNTGPFSDEALRRIYATLIQQTRKLERQLNALREKQQLKRAVAQSASSKPASRKKIRRGNGAS